MTSDSLPAATLAVARERVPARVVDAIAATLAGQEQVALARVWLLGRDDVCPECPAAGSGEDGRALHLVASAGTPADAAEPWTRLDGEFHRVPLGQGKIGRAGATGTGILLHDMSDRSSWIARPEWAARERIRSFAAQPLNTRGETLGILAVFRRVRTDATAFGWLRAFADHAAVSLDNARALVALERAGAGLAAENACLRADARAVLGRFVDGASAAMRRVREQVDLVAPTDAPVLLSGEPGTGKEMLAHSIHERSRRAAGPLIKVDCTAGDVVRRLFGGAGVAARWDAADGGTLFLDELAELPLDAQTALLRALDRRRRGGEAASRGVDVRIVASTSRDLAAAVAAGRFVADLHLRLSVFPIVVPPLRARAGDVAELATHFVRRACARLGRPPFTLSTGDVRTLERHAWPGNVRELARVVEHAVALAASDRLRLDAVLGAPGSHADGVIPIADWRRRERANVEAALTRTGGRIYGPGGAAELLGVPPTTLASRVKALGLGRPIVR